MGAMADELDELYEVRQDEFTALRTKLAAAAKQRGDTDTAKQISAARKPTAAAWVVNRLALRDRDIRTRLAGLGERLKDAHSAMDGDRIRALSAEQRRLVDDVARAAFEEAELADPSAALRDDVTGTLQAAESALTAAQDAYDKGKQASRDAAAVVKQAKAQLR